MLKYLVMIEDRVKRSGDIRWLFCAFSDNLIANVAGPGWFSISRKGLDSRRVWGLLRLRLIKQ